MGHRQTNTNTLLEYIESSEHPSKNFFFPYSELKISEFSPALKAAAGQLDQDLTRIKAETVVTFENTVVAFEQAFEALNLIATQFGILKSSNATPDLFAIAGDLMIEISRIEKKVFLDADLFKRVQFLFQKKESLKLTDEESKLLEEYFKSFDRNGALLSVDQKSKLKVIDDQLNQVSAQFAENALKATQKFELVINDKKDLKGLPDSLIESAQRGPDKWIFTLKAPSLLPFLMFSEIRELRKKMWFANSSRAFNDEFSNVEVVKKIITLRHRRAQLLGTSSHAEFVLKERMAETPDKVFDFIQNLYQVVIKGAQKDFEEILYFKQTMDGQKDLMPWDYLFYSEKLKEKKYKLSEELLRPYFKLDSTLQGVFEIARRLYGLTFRKLESVPVFHEDVICYQVTEEKTQKFMALLYCDFFPRDEKQGGAWMSVVRKQGLFKGDVLRPHVMISCNFPRPSASQPSLLNFQEARTLFHEFGHALHEMLSDCRFQKLSGTEVLWDFVELPSQLMENWLLETDSLRLFAQHYKTKEMIPNSLIENLKQANQFQIGYQYLRQLQLAYLDMRVHTADPKEIEDLDKFEKKVTERFRLFPTIQGTNALCSFSHLFGGGYSAGYYSYKWAEVLEADCFEYFKEKGVLSSEVGQKFKNHILSRGGTEHPMELYKKFLGREPLLEPLLKRDGFL